MNYIVLWDGQKWKSIWDNIVLEYFQKLKSSKHLNAKLVLVHDEQPTSIKSAK